MEPEINETSTWADTATVDQTKPKLDDNQWNVVIFNDDHTSFELVIMILVNVFRKQQEESFDLAISVHNNGKAVAAVYDYEMAEQKTIEAIAMARSFGSPLVVEMEKQ